MELRKNSISRLVLSSDCLFMVFFSCQNKLNETKVSQSNKNLAKFHVLTSKWVICISYDSISSDDFNCFSIYTILYCFYPFRILSPCDPTGFQMEFEYYLTKKLAIFSLIIYFQESFCATYRCNPWS